MVKKHFLIKFLIFVVILAAAVIVLLHPVVKMDENPVHKYNSLVDLRNAKLQEITNQLMKEKQNYFNIKLSEDELNDILYLSTREAAAERNLLGQIIDDKICLYVDFKIFGILPSQASAVLQPQILDNQIICRIEKAKLGRIPISSNLVLKKLKSYNTLEVEPDKGYILLVSGLPSQLTLSNLQVTDKSINVKVDVSIKSLKDLLLLLENIQKLK